ncbi:MAG: hypothetical protein R2789_17685 [Microthrixaceae bacterium]
MGEDCDLAQRSPGGLGGADPERGDRPRVGRSAVARRRGRPEECWGFAYWNITDYDDYGVEHRDIDGLLADGISYNLWRGEDVTVGAEEWAQTTRMIMQLDEYVIDISLGTKQTLSAGDEHVVANLAKQIITRLQT